MSVSRDLNAARPTISRGGKKRVAIAGVLAMDPDVLILDEPTSGLDPSGDQKILWNFLMN